MISGNLAPSAGESVGASTMLNLDVDPCGFGKSTITDLLFDAAENLKGAVVIVSLNDFRSSSNVADSAVEAILFLLTERFDFNVVPFQKFCAFKLEERTNKARTISFF